MGDGLSGAIVDKKFGMVSGMDRVGRYETLWKMVLITGSQKRVFSQSYLLRLLWQIVLLWVPD